MNSRLCDKILRREARSITVWLLAFLTMTSAWCQSDVGAKRTEASSPTPAFTIKSAHPRILLGNPQAKERLTRVLNSRATSGSLFRSQVDAQLAGTSVYAFQPWYAALMFQLTGERRYALYAIEATDGFVIAEERRIESGEKAAVAGNSYLHAGQYVGNVALVYDWCHDLLTSRQRERWIAYANQAVSNIWNHRQARWGAVSHPWTGWSVDNPSNNYYYSFLRATMLLGLASHRENPEAQRWIDQFRTSKLEKQLLPTFNRDLQGGGSREGTGYGTALRGLWQLYDWWERSTGEGIAALTPHTRASMAHMMHSVTPTLDQLVPTGDHTRDASAALFDYHREYLLILMALFPDDRLSGVAASMLEQSSVPQMKNKFMHYADFMYEQPELRPRPLGDLATSYWAPGTGQFMLRSAWERSATFANFICGPYSESHAHRDQGSFLIFKGGWLAIDPNIYSRSGIDQDEELHNLVRIEHDGKTIRQNYDTSCAMKALTDTEVFAYASADVSPVYAKNNVVKKLEREFVFVKPNIFVVLDRAETSQATRKTWTLNLPGEPRVEGRTIKYANGKNRLDVHLLSPATSELVVHDWPEIRKSVRSGTRVDVSDYGKTTHFLHVLSLDGAVETTEVLNAAGVIGARIKLRDGATINVGFSINGRGGNLHVSTADRRVLADRPFPSTVEPASLFVN